MKWIIIGFVLVAVFIAGCQKSPTGNVAGDLSLQELCAQNGGMFMKMMPTIDGVPTGDPACAGCMLGSSHYCDKEQYLKALAAQR